MYTLITICIMLSIFLDNLRWTGHNCFLYKFNLSNSLDAGYYSLKST